MREVDADVRDAAKAMGLTGRPGAAHASKLPLAIPFVMAGVRTASIEVVATSTLAAYVSYTDLGTPVIAGLNTNNTVEAFAGAAPGGRAGRAWSPWASASCSGPSPPLPCAAGPPGRRGGGSGRVAAATT